MKKNPFTVPFEFALFSCIPSQSTVEFYFVEEKTTFHVCMSAIIFCVTVQSCYWLYTSVQDSCKQDKKNKKQHRRMHWIFGCIWRSMNCSTKRITFNGTRQSQITWMAHVY